MRALTPVLLILALAAPAAAQEREIRDANLPRALEAELLHLYRGPAERFSGPTTITRLQVVRGDVAATGGPLLIEGRVIGDVAMVGGDVDVAPGGSVTGRIMVVSGEVRLASNATVGGTITAYGTPGAGRVVADRRRPERHHDWRRRAQRDPDQGFSRLTVRAGHSYNRVEGLPLMFGPVIQTAGSNPLRLEALAIWRTESAPSLETERMGYQVRAEQFLGGDRSVSLGGMAYSTVEPMDRWQITDLEASLSAAVFHMDQRDYYDQTGWGAFFRMEPARGAEARVTYREDRHSALPAGDPWSLFHRQDVWRLQPAVAEGTVRSVGASLALDRVARREPRSGWHARLSVERPIDGELTRPALSLMTRSLEPRYEDETVPPSLPAMDMSLDFTTAFIDLRRYSPVGSRSELNVRVVGGGAMGETPLPPQYQHALGGIGTLPGFDTFHADCGARRAFGVQGNHRYFPAYGCDRFALAQVEYRGALSFDFGFGDPGYDPHDWWDDVRVDMSPNWVVFFDAGRGWAFADAADPAGEARTTGTLFDAGVGFLIGKLGIYAALPLNGDVEQSPRFFLRWGARF